MGSLTPLEAFGVFGIFICIVFGIIFIMVFIIEPLVDKLVNRYRAWRYYSITCQRCGRRTPYYEAKTISARTYSECIRRFEALYCAYCGEKIIKIEKEKK